MPSFMPIGLKLLALEGYRQTDRQTDRDTLIIQMYIDDFLLDRGFCMVNYLFCRCCADSECVIAGLDRDCIPQMEACDQVLPYACMGTQQCCRNCNTPLGCVPAAGCVAPNTAIDLVCPGSEVCCQAP